MLSKTSAPFQVDNRKKNMQQTVNSESLYQSPQVNNVPVLSSYGRYNINLFIGQTIHCDIYQQYHHIIQHYQGNTGEEKKKMKKKKEKKKNKTK